MNKIIIVSAPSGAGKTTLINRIMQDDSLRLEFSISACTRKPREGEADGVNYYFLTEEDFKRRIAQNEFIEWQEVYAGRYYGTLNSEIDRIFAKGNNIIFDVDVEGGINLKKIFGTKALSIFIQPPSVDELRRRLESRATDAPEEIDRRVAKAQQEIERSVKFDTVVTNDILDRAEEELKNKITLFLNR
ncbi:MAG: guanylate kinase [Bacteroidales bacterium]|nr:guanylate kinase [Bacteroidales bacterium]